MEQQMELVRLVDDIESTFDKFGYPLPREATRRVQEWEQEIDARVARLYGLSAAEVATIAGAAAAGAAEGDEPAMA